MQDDHKAENGWEDEEYEDYENDGDEVNQDDEWRDAPSPKKKKEHRRLLTSIQVYGCLAILIAAFILKLSGTDLYTQIRGWYQDALNDSIVAQEQMSQAKRTVVGLWSDLSSAGFQTSSGTVQSSGTGSQSSQVSVPAQSRQPDSKSQTAESDSAGL